MSTSDDGKLAAIISYFTIIGWLIAYFAIYQKDKRYQATFHLRQTLLYHLLSMVIVYAAGPVFLLFGVSIGMALLWIVRVGLFIIWIIGLLSALQGERKLMPLIGKPAQSIFSGI
jgi:uncharacterized membrane protein